MKIISLLCMVVSVAVCCVSVIHGMDQLLLKAGDPVVLPEQCIVVPYTQLSKKPNCNDFVIISGVKVPYLWAQVIAVKKVLQSRDCVYQYTVVQRQRADGLQIRSTYEVEKLYTLIKQRPLVEMRDPNSMDYHWAQ